MKRIPSGNKSMPAWKRRDGFSVIELLVAMVLLLIITAVFGRFFQRSTQSWESGMRTVETMISGRSAVNLIVRDIERAIADQVLVDEIINDGDPAFQISGRNDMRLIIMPSREPYRAHRVRYYLQGGTLIRETADDGGIDLIENVEEVVFGTLGAPPGNYRLPAAVSIKLRLSSRYDDDPARDQEFVAQVYPVHHRRYPDVGAAE